MNQLTAAAWQDLSSSIGSPTLLTIGILLRRHPVLIFELLHDQFIFFPATQPSLPFANCTTAIVKILINILSSSFTRSFQDFDLS